MGETDCDRATKCLEQTRAWNDLFPREVAGPHPRHRLLQSDPWTVGCGAQWVGVDPHPRHRVAAVNRSHVLLTIARTTPNAKTALNPSTIVRTLLQMVGSFCCFACSPSLE